VIKEINRIDEFIKRVKKLNLEKIAMQRGRSGFEDKDMYIFYDFEDFKNYMKKLKEYYLRESERNYKVYMAVKEDAEIVVLLVGHHFVIDDFAMTVYIVRKRIN
jgi:pyruvate/2-oxoacid:ferredoxin oxidoreductase alpha subunit